MQYNFDIEIPKELILKEKQNTIDFNALKGKTIIGLVGYKKSGKDVIATQFVKEFDFKRIAFADILKQEMNSFLVEAVRCDLGWNKDAEIDFLTEDINKKYILRPYLIWFGEKLRKINGVCFWINRALEGVNENRIVISDIRRFKELELFENTLSQWKKKKNSFKQAKTIFHENSAQQISLGNLKEYSAHLFHVSQFENIDNDVLTMECIRIAQEKWLFDETIYLDPRIPKNKYTSSTKDKVKKLASKYNVKKLTSVEINQISLLP